MKYVHHYKSPLGGISIVSDGAALTGLWFDGQKNFPAAAVSGCERKNLPVFEQTVRWLNLYFSGLIPDFTPPIELHGTEFQKRIWNILLAIPPGKTASYGEIAGKAAAGGGTGRMSARAVGSAVGRNPVSLIVPCHRVIGSDGKLTGYAGGLERKKILLFLEESGTLSVPVFSGGIFLGG